MDNQDIRTLRILEEIEENQAPSQRYLSEQLNISLGLVNSFLKRLAQKGYFKATTIPRNRVKYILTPKGALEKSRLTYAYVQQSFQFYRDARKRIKTTLRCLEVNGATKIVFYGSGDIAEIAYLSLQETNIKLTGIFDDEIKTKRFFQYKIQSPEELENSDFDKLLVTKIGDFKSHQEKLIQYGIEKDRILAAFSSRVNGHQSTN